MRTWNFQKAASLLNLSLLLVYFLLGFQLRDRLKEGYSDFVSFYTAGTILEHGAFARLYDMDLQYEIQREAAPNVRSRQVALPFVRPAFEAWIFWPLAHLPYGTAFIIWDLLSCGCLLLALFFLRQEIPELQKIGPTSLIISALCYFPVFFTLVQGQDSILLLLIYVLSFKAFRRNRQFLSGLILGFAIFKFPLVIPFLIPLALKRKLRVILGFALTSLFLTAVSVATVGLPTAAYYPKYLLSIDTLAKGVNRADDMTNVRGLLGLFRHSILPPGPGMLLLLLFSLLLLGFVVRKSSFDPCSHAFPLELGLNLVVTVLVSYHCHVFDLSVLLLPISLMVGFTLSDNTIVSTIRRELMWVLSLVLFSPLYLWATYIAQKPSLLAPLLLGFACVIGMVIAELRKSQTALTTILTTYTD